LNKPADPKKTETAQPAVSGASASAEIHQTSAVEVVPEAPAKEGKDRAAGPADDKGEKSSGTGAKSSAPASGSSVIPPAPQVISIDLLEALNLAGAENPTIAIAQAATRVAQAQQLAACVLLLPDLNAGASVDQHTGNLQTSSGVIRQVDRQSFYLGAGGGPAGAGTVPVPGVFLFSPLADALYLPKTAKQVVETRYFEAAATNNSVLLDVGVRYYALVGAEGRLAALRQTELDIGEVARLTAEHVKANLGLPSDADRAKAEELLFRLQEQQAQEEAAVASALLAQLLNLDPSSRLQPREGPVQLIALTDPAQPLESLIGIAMENRPEIKARAATVAASEVRYRQEKVRPFLPTLSVGYSAGAFGGGSNLAGTPFGHFNGRTDLDAYAFWTLQNLGLGNLALQKRRRVEIEEAQSELVASVNRVRDEVAEAHADSAARQRDLEVARRKLERAQDGMKRDLQRVRAFQGKPIEVLDNARLLASARQEFVNALTQYNQAQLRLFVALGQPPTLALPVADGKATDPTSAVAPR